MNLKLLLVLTRCFSSVSREIEPILKEESITFPQFFALEALLCYSKLTVKKLTEKCFSTAGTMTVIISNLEKKGLINRIVNDHDKRESFIQLTQEGKLTILQLLRNLENSLQEEFNILTPTEKTITIELLKKLGKGKQK